MSQRESSLTGRQRHWLDHIKACELAGRTLTEYAREHGLDLRSLYAGKRTLVVKGVLPAKQGARFQRVRSSSMDDAWRVQLANGVTVGFSGLVDARALSLVLAAAAAVE